MSGSVPHKTFVDEYGPFTIPTLFSLILTKQPETADVYTARGLVDVSFCSVD
jgi:hypothetical protein